MTWPDPLASEQSLAQLGSVDLNLLVPLLALLDERSVTVAATRVGLSQPAMSHALRRLRVLFDDELLVRQGAAMLPTPRAELLLEPLRELLQRSTNLLNPEPFEATRDDRTVTIALSTTTAFVFGARMVGAMQRLAPNMTLRLQTAGAMDAQTVFADRGVDAVLLSQGYPSPYPRERLYDDRWVVLAPPETGRATDPRSTLELISTELHIAYGDGTGPRARPYEVLDEHGVTYSLGTRVNDYLLAPHLLSEVGGVTLHRLQAGLEFQRMTGLRVLEFPFAVLGLGIDLIWNPWLGDDAFREWLRSVLREAAAPLRERVGLGMHRVNEVHASH